MKLLEVSFKNIFCYGDELRTIKFDGPPGLTHIMGNNGHGKSTLLKVIKLGIYNEPGKNTHLKDVANETNGSGYINIKLISKGKHCEIESGFSPNFIVLRVDGENITDKFSGANEVKNYIRDELIDVPYHIFNNVLSISMSDFVSFLKLKAEDARNIRDRMFGLGILNKINAKLKEDVGIEVANLNSLESKMETLKSVIRNGQLKLEEEKNRDDADVKNEIIELEQRLYDLGQSLAEKTLEKNDLEASMVELATKRDHTVRMLQHKAAHAKLVNMPDFVLAHTTQYNDVAKGLDELKPKFERLNELNDKLVSGIAKYNAQLETQRNNLQLYENGVCSECGTDLTDGDHIHKKDTIETTIRELEAKLKEAQNGKNKIAVGRKSLDDSSRNLTGKLNTATTHLRNTSTELVSLMNEARSGRMELNTIVSSYRGFLTSGNPKLEFAQGFYKELTEWLEANKPDDSVTQETASELEDAITKLTSELNTIKQALDVLTYEKNAAEKSLEIKKAIIDNLSGKASRIQAMEDMLEENKVMLKEAKEKYGKQKVIVDSYSAARRATQEVKPRIIASSIPTLNKLLNDNLHMFGLPLQVTFNDDFTTIVKRNGHVINHSTISDGQRRMVDFCIVAANIQLVFLLYSDINFIFLDEIFASLSQENVAIMSEACRIFCDKMNLHTFIISHHHLSEEIIDRFISVKFENGFSSFKLSNNLLSQ